MHNWYYAGLFLLVLWALLQAYPKRPVLDPLANLESECRLILWVVVINAVVWSYYLGHLKAQEVWRTHCNLVAHDKLLCVPPRGYPWLV